MKRDESRVVAGHVLAAIRDIADPTERNRVAAKVIREEVNKLLGISESPENQILELLGRVEKLNTDLLQADQDIGRRVFRNVQLVRELHEVKKASGT